MQTLGFNSWVEKIPWRRTWQPTPVFLPEDPMDRDAVKLQSTGLQESDTTQRLNYQSVFMILLRRIWYEKFSKENEFYFGRWFCFLLILTYSKIQFRMSEEHSKIDKLSELEYRLILCQFSQKKIISKFKDEQT